MSLLATNRMWRFAAITVAILAVIAGCNYPPKGAKQDPTWIEDYPQISALEKLHRVIVVSDVVREDGPPLKVTVITRNNTSDDERDIQYRFFFLDTAGVPETTDPDWHYMHMPARTAVYLQGNALDDAATDWRLEIRPAR